MAQNDISRTRLLASAFYIYPLFCLILVALIMAFAPGAYDDYWFRGEYLELCDEEGWEYSTIGSPSTVWAMLQRDYVQDNARWLNYFGLWVITLPIWVWKVIKIVGFTFFGHFAITIAGVKFRQLQKEVWTLFLVVFAIGWEYGFLSFMFFCNYVLTSVILLWVMKLFFNGGFKSWTAIFAGMLLGACHESFGLAFIGGATVCCIFHRRFITRGNIWAFAGCVVGLMWLVLAPSWNGSHVVRSFRWLMVGLIAQVWYVPVYLVGWAIMLALKKTRSIAGAPLPLFALGTMPLVIVGCIGFKPRAAFPCNLLAVCATVEMLYCLISPRVARSLWARALSVLAAFATLFHLGAVAKTSFIIGRETENLDRLCTEAAARGIKRFYPLADVTMPWDSPWYVLRRPFNEHFRFTRLSLAREHCYQFDKVVAVPSVLRNFTEEKSTPVPSMPGFRFMDGYLVGPAEVEEGEYGVSVFYGNFNEHNATLAVPFTTADGNEYKYFFVDRNLIGSFLGTPTDAIVHFNQDEK